MSSHNVCPNVEVMLTLSAIHNCLNLIHDDLRLSKKIGILVHIIQIFETKIIFLILQGMFDIGLHSGKSLFQLQVTA